MPASQPRPGMGLYRHRNRGGIYSEKKTVKFHFRSTAPIYGLTLSDSHTILPQNKKKSHPFFTKRKNVTAPYGSYFRKLELTLKTNLHTKVRPHKEVI